MKISAREKKILYTGIVTAVAIAIYLTATTLSPGDGENLAQKIETQESLLHRQRDLVGRKEFYEKRIEVAENDITRIRSLLLPENNSTAAGTELQRILSDFAARSGVVITQKSNLPERKVADNDSLIKISVRVTLDCSLEGLVDFLVAIKNYDKFLRVEEMTIQTVAAQAQRPMAIRRPLSMSVAGYISVRPPDESGEGNI